MINTISTEIRIKLAIEHSLGSIDPFVVISLDNRGQLKFLKETL